MTGEACDILIVDDQPGVRRLLFEAFIDQGLRVETASSGAEAIRKTIAATPLLILLDIKMPGMSGLETLEELQRINPEIQVVMMTAYGELDILVETRSRGVQHYINKPFDLDEVRYLVKGLLMVEKDRRKRARETG
ncbi:MAG: response regulator [Pelotomaculaceae bacterium]|jgi:two-component system response regulator (stage 0 sporulation protein F)|nr:response regulator [Bacillota bacterium]HHU86072.1 response regulator [Peptococcaceae bacterium]